MVTAFWWQLQKRTIRAPRNLQLPNGVNFRAYPDCVVSSGLIYADYPEYYELSFLRRQLRPGQVLIDVGANVGHISLLLADVIGPPQIFAFEPTPISFARLVENWKLNNWETDNLFQNAIGSKACEVDIPNVVSPITTNSPLLKSESGRSVQVAMVTLDSKRALWRDRTIGLLKIDVEGYELEAFRGARDLLERDRPRFVMFESLGGTLDPEIGAILDYSGYKVFQLSATGQPDFTQTYAQDLFAVRTDEQAALAG